ncbi:MAG: heavy metal-binding domain-containing protein [Defluviitaleaceae bacterium]|nr:heavy metal-binding domain-containing protein [Defluviitaleaceae bacterium]
MLVVTVDTIPGKNFEVLGGVVGSTVQAKHIGRDFMAGLKTLVGGEIEQYTELLIESRRIATDRMVAQAKNMNADAVIAVRYATSSVMEGSSEVMVYGTAVRFTQ